MLRLPKIAGGSSLRLWLCNLVFVLGLHLAVSSLAISASNDFAALSTDITFSHCVLLFRPLWPEQVMTSIVVPELAWSPG